MSCCDNSSITITNLTNQTWTVAVSMAAGSISGISNGTTIAPGGTVKGSASSASGTSGIAGGSFNFTAPNNLTAGLLWEFMPDSAKGACPCMVNGATGVSTTSGNTQYTVFFQKVWPGFSDGDAGFACAIVACQT